MTTGPAPQTDFDLHGLVGVRVIDGTPSDVAVVRRQLGHPETRLAREPDLTIRFVDRLAPTPLTLVGVGESGYDAGSVLRFLFWHVAELDLRFRDQVIARLQ